MTKHIYNYNTHAEKRYFLGNEHRDLYDMIALNGNIVSHTPGGVADFVATAGKDFYIDPQTHAFQHPTEHLKRDVSDKKKNEPPRYEFKPSIIRLANERLGTLFSDVIKNDRPISPTRFFGRAGMIDNKAVTEICQSIGDFQLDTMRNSLDDEAREFMDGAAMFKPKFLVAPYFYLSSDNWKQWLTINIACYQKMRELFRDWPIYFNLMLSRDRLNDWDEIIEALSPVKPDGILLWIDEHVEEGLGVSEIESYVNFLRGLKRVTDTVYNSHGGYLSILLCHSEAGDILDGVGHAMNYGEHRSVIPIGGGIPMAWFYLLSAHSRLRFGDATKIVQPRGWLGSITLYRENICMCHQCQELLSAKGSAEIVFDEVYGKSRTITITWHDGTKVSRNYPTKEAKQAATRHYLYNKAKEFDDIAGKSFSEVLQQLKSEYDKISLGPGGGFVAHLITWHNALNKLFLSQSGG